MAEANPLRGFPRLRRAAVRSAGRWEAASGAVMLQQKRGCSRSFPEFSTAAQRLCSAAQQKQNPPLGFDVVSVRGRPTFVSVVWGCTRCGTAGYWLSIAVCWRLSTCAVLYNRLGISIDLMRGSVHASVHYGTTIRFHRMTLRRREFETKIDVKRWWFGTRSVVVTLHLNRCCSKTSEKVNTREERCAAAFPV